MDRSTTSTDQVTSAKTTEDSPLETGSADEELSADAVEVQTPESAEDAEEEVSITYWLHHQMRWQDLKAFWRHLFNHFQSHQLHFQSEYVLEQFLRYVLLQQLQF